MSDDNGENSSLSEYIVRVRGLPWSAKEAEIKEFFNACEEIKSIHFTYTREGRPTGEAYIELGNSQDVALALLKHRENMKDRYIEVFEAKRAEMEYVLKRSGKPDLNSSDTDTVVRLRGLPFGCTKEDVCNFFSGMEIAPDGIVWATDGSGRVTGEAYVRFLDKETTERALDKHMQNIGHRYIEVFRSTNDEMLRVQRRSGGVSGYFPNRGGGNGGRYDGGTDDGYQAPSKPYSLLDMPFFNDSRFDGGYNNDYYGGPLDRDLYTMHRDRGGGRSNYGSRRGTLGLPSLFDDDIYGGGGPYNSNRFRERDRSPVARTSAIGRATGHVVHMRGLPFKATASDIIEFFNPLKVLNVNVLFDERSGRPMGEADVEFNCHEDALEAMRKNKEHMGERYIELFLNSVQRGRGAASASQGLSAAGPTTDDDYPSLVQYPNLGAYTSFSSGRSY